MQRAVLMPLVKTIGLVLAACCACRGTTLVQRRLSAQDVRDILHLSPLPNEGGYFVQTYRSNEVCQATGLPPRYADDRSLGTEIFYVVTREQFSALHRLRSDEVYHFYFGDPVVLVQLHSDGHSTLTTLGSDIDRGMSVQATVPRGTFQGVRMLDGGSYALLGTSVFPGFEYRDFELGQREELIARFPERRSLIQALTR